MTDHQRTRAEGTGAGAAGGAVLGGLLGQVLGGDTKSTVLGAGIGAILGSAAGNMYGEHVAQKKAQYTSSEDYYTACIASARTMQNNIQRYNTSLRNDIASLKRENSKMLALYNSKRATKSALQRQQSKSRAKLAEANKKLKSARHEIAMQRGVLQRERNTNSPKLAALNRQIQQLERTAQELEGNTLMLASIDERIHL